MAVPKRKTSKSKRNMRRAHDKLKPMNVIIDSVTGEYRRPHHLSAVDGSYNGRQVVVEKNDPDAIDETEAETL